MPEKTLVNFCLSTCIYFSDIFRLFAKANRLNASKNYDLYESSTFRYLQAVFRRQCTHEDNGIASWVCVNFSRTRSVNMCSGSEHTALSRHPLPQTPFSTGSCILLHSNMLAESCISYSDGHRISKSISCRVNLKWATTTGQSVR